MERTSIQVLKETQERLRTISKDNGSCTYDYILQKLFELYEKNGSQL